MAKFYGIIGYSETKEVSPGIWKEVITEREYCGDLLRNTNKFQSSDKLNDNINISNEVSIVADPYARDNFHLMRYVRFNNHDVRWKVISVEVQYPRLILNVGGVYNE